MAKVRVHELAKELGYKSKDVLEQLKKMGEFVSSASSTIEPPVVRKLREVLPEKAAAKPKEEKKAAPKPGPVTPAVPASVEEDTSDASGRDVQAVDPHVGVPSPATEEAKPPVGDDQRSPRPAGPRPGPQQSAPSQTGGPQGGQRQSGPRPGNNPFSSAGSTGMGRREGPRPGNNPFSSGAASGMGRSTGGEGRGSRSGGPGADMPPRPARPGMNPRDMAGRMGGRPGGGRPAGPGGGGRPGQGAPGAGRGGGLRTGAGAGRGGPGGGRGGAPGGGPGGPGGPGGFGPGGPPGGGRGAGRGGRAGTAGAFGRGGGRSKGRKSKKLRKQEFDNLQAPTIGGVQIPHGDGSTVVRLARGSSLTDFAERINANPASLVTALFHLGEMATATQSLDEETFALLGAELGYDVQVVSPEDEDRELLESFEIDADVEDTADQLSARPPVVTVMGHVDHGKTKLLDAIRRTNVVAKEAGGITQHIGAYQVTYHDRKLTFIDTPGHEAFTAMRARGAKVTDIAVLVVAADDGVMPQTIEALNHAQAAEVPIVVAVNKVDKEGANPDRIRQQLTEYNLVAEEYGGQTLFVEVSAKQGINIDGLLEAILLTADAELELVANANAPARGVSIEGHLDRGRGPIATILVQRGTLRVGDPLVAGNAHGRVRAMLDEHGDHVPEARPSRPVQVLGLDSVPGAGDKFLVTEEERTARQIAERRSARQRNAALAKARKRVSLEDLTKIMEQGAIETLNLIIKGDVSGSVEALEESLVKIDVGEEVELRIIHRGVGAINKSDVDLAAASNAIIIGFNVRPEGKVGELAEREGIDVRYYSIIYQAIDEVEAALKGMLKPEFEEAQLGTAEVRETYRSSKFGTIAGCLVRSGEIRRNSKARLIRGGVVVADNLSVSSLKRFKDDATEVREGFECGISLGNFNDIKVEDVIETFEMREKPR